MTQRAGTVNDLRDDLAKLAASCGGADIETRSHVGGALLGTFFVIASMDLGVIGAIRCLREAADCYETKIQENIQ